MLQAILGYPVRLMCRRWRRVSLAETPETLEADQRCVTGIQHPTGLLVNWQPAHRLRSHKAFPQHRAESETLLVMALIRCFDFSSHSLPAEQTVTLEAERNQWILQSGSAPVAAFPRTLWADSSTQLFFLSFNLRELNRVAVDAATIQATLSCTLPCANSLS